MRFIGNGPAFVAVAATCLLMLSGCSGDNGSARQVLGLDREGPDAFAVSTHAPLAVPQQLDARLPVPQPGMARPQEVSVQQTARGVVFNGDGQAITSSAPSVAERTLLQQAGPVDDNVRAIVNREATKDAAAQHGPLDWALFWRSKVQPGVAVDAPAEAERLARARAAGQAATSGPTPVIEDSGRLGAPEEIQ